MLYEPRLHVVLYQPEIPQNTGNVGRTCVAAGAKLWLVRPLGFRLDEHHLKRAGLDYWQHLDHEVVDDWQSLQQSLTGDRNWWFCSKRADKTYTEACFEAGDVLVFGCETQGLPDHILDPQDEHAIRIPMRQQVRSLNLASAVAVMVYETLRQTDGFSS